MKWRDREQSTNIVDMRNSPLDITMDWMKYGFYRSGRGIGDGIIIEFNGYIKKIESLPNETTASFTVYFEVVSSLGETPEEYQRITGKQKASFRNWVDSRPYGVKLFKEVTLKTITGIDYTTKRRYIDKMQSITPDDLFEFGINIIENKKWYQPWKKTTSPDERIYRNIYRKKEKNPNAF